MYLGMVGNTCHPSTGSLRQEDHKFKGGQSYSGRQKGKRGRRATTRGGKTRVKWVGVAKEMEVPTLAARCFPIGQVGTTRKRWARGIPLKIPVSDEVGKAVPPPRQ